MNPSSEQCRRLSKEEINSLPIRNYEGEICLVRTHSELKLAIANLRKENVIGFDTETKPTFRKGKINAPSLIQFAGANVVYLIQLQFVDMGLEVASILESPSIVKAGVSIRDDIKELQKMYNFESDGLIDLADVAHKYKLESYGLRNLAAKFFNWRITKGSQCSNWSQPRLSSRQMAYAATDAWVGREVYLKMKELGMLE